MTRYNVQLIDRCHWSIDVEASNPEHAIARARTIWELRNPDAGHPPRGCAIAVEARFITHGAVTDAVSKPINERTYHA